MQLPRSPVPFGACLEAVDLAQVVEQHLAAKSIGTPSDREHVLAGAEVGPQPDQVPSSAPTKVNSNCLKKPLTPSKPSPTSLRVSMEKHR